MFKKSLESKFKAVFEIKKVSFDQPGDTQEQECLFIEIENARNSIKDGKAHAMVSGSAVMFGINDKMPFGFFSKAINQADPLLTKDLFFSEIESNTKLYRDKVQRGFSFVYFFDSQYDPDTGSITSVDLNYE